MAKLAKVQSEASLTIIKKIQDKSFDPKELDTATRKSLVAVLRHEITDPEIAHLLQVSDRTIGRDIQFIKRQCAKLVKNITLDSVAGDFIKSARVLYSKAIKAKDYSLAWSIAQGVITKLQSLGLIKQTASKLNISGKVDHTHRDIEEAPEEDLDSIVSQYVAGTKGGNGGRLGRESAPAHN